MRRFSTLLLATALYSGCAASQHAERPHADTDFTGGRAGFDGLIAGDYYVPQPADVHLGSLPEQPGTQYVSMGDPGFRPVGVEGGVPAVQAAVGRAAAGITCPVRGRVFVSALIDSSGTARGPRVAGGTHPTCDARALDAYRSLQFTPAQLDGRAVAMPLTIPISFE